MARINKSKLTKLEIINEATKQFLEKGYSATTVSSIAKALEMSTGNLTFYFPTKDHLLAELVDMLCGFQWALMREEAGEGLSDLMAICLELTTMACACENNEILKDFFISSYTNPICLDIIRRNDTQRAQKVFGEFRPEWREEQFAEAEILISGIEYATLMTAGIPVPLETRIAGALRNIMTIYGVPEETQKIKLEKVFLLDYKKLSDEIVGKFKKYVSDENEKAFKELLKI